MSGAIVTASGEAFKGYHQCPNILRDKYMPLVGIDGYAFLNYLLSWANANTTLSVRRMKRDLGVSQDRLERIQGSVLQHCAFITLTPGGPKQANRWHVDAELLWAENALHMVERFQARQGKAVSEGVPAIGTLLPSPSPEGVPAIGTPSVPTIGTPRTGERYTLKKVLNTKKEKKEERRGATLASDSPASSSLSGAGEKESKSPQQVEQAAPAETPTPATPNVDPAPPVQVDSLHGGHFENDAPDTENFPGGAAAGENIHNPETGEVVISEAEQREAAVNLAIDKLCNGAWLKEQRGAPAWITETDTKTGVLRSEIARLLDVSDVDAARQAAIERRLSQQRAAQSDPSVRVLTFSRLLVVELQNMALSRRLAVSQAIHGASAAPAARATAPAWQVGQRVRWGGCVYEIEDIKADTGTLFLYSDKEGSVSVQRDKYGQLQLVS